MAKAPQIVQDYVPKHPDTCQQCDQVHQLCQGHNKTGQPCKLPPKQGSPYCVYHSKDRKPPRKKIARRSQKLAAEKINQQLVYPRTLGQKYDIDPIQALLNEIHWTAGHVEWLRAKVQELKPEDLVWGKTKEKTGGDDRGTTHEAKPNAWYELYMRERDHLAKITVAAIKAGIDAKRTEIAQQQGQLVAAAIQTILDQMKLTVGIQDINTWDEAVATIVPAQLRTIVEKDPA